MYAKVSRGGLGSAHMPRKRPALALETLAHHLLKLELANVARDLGERRAADRRAGWLRTGAYFGGLADPLDPPIRRRPAGSFTFPEARVSAPHSTAL